MGKMNFYGKNITLQPDFLMQTDLLCYFCFLLDEPEKEELLRSNLGYQILSRSFPNDHYFLQYFLDIKILYVSLIAETLLSSGNKSFP